VDERTTESSTHERAVSLTSPPDGKRATKGAALTSEEPTELKPCKCSGLLYPHTRSFQLRCVLCGHRHIA
jgi:hypothetical protein